MFVRETGSKPQFKVSRGNLFRLDKQSDILAEHFTSLKMCPVSDSVILTICLRKIEEGHNLKIM